MYKQTEHKKELFDAIQDFHHELINENSMISHKMLGENYQRDLNSLYELYSKSFDFTGMEEVSSDFYFLFPLAWYGRYEPDEMSSIGSDFSF